MISPSMVLAADAVNHVGGWGPTTWFWHAFFALAGWAAIGAPVYIMHRLETEEAEQKPVAATAAGGPAPAEPEPSVLSSPYMAFSFALGIVGTVTAATLSWSTVRHLDTTILVILWWMLPFVCCVAVWMYWLLEKTTTQTSSADQTATQRTTADRYAPQHMTADRYAAQQTTADQRQTNVVRSRSGWAAALAGLVYVALGVAIAGADLITRLAATVELTSDALIVLVLIGILGWGLWLIAPRRRGS